MVSKALTVVFLGSEAIVVEVQAIITPGMPSFSVLGLSGSGSKEIADRTRVALLSSGVSLPPKKITLSFSPAGITKCDSKLDLAVSVALLRELGVIRSEESILDNAIFLGELSLDGEISRVCGILPAALFSASNNFTLVCPQKNIKEASWVNNCTVFGPKDLRELVSFHHNQDSKLNNNMSPASHVYISSRENYRDIKSVQGVPILKRVALIAAAGRHNLLMVGPPGSGKSLLAECIRGILPDLSCSEAAEAACAASLIGEFSGEQLTLDPPFRSPHHSASPQALAGGGRFAAPGEIAMAHKGVLFMDEFPEFSIATLETLRQPLETGKISVSRAEARAEYKADIQLIAAMNACKCGRIGSSQECRKAPLCSQEYMRRISSPLLDRIDLFVSVDDSESSSNCDDVSRLNSKEMKLISEKVKQIQSVRNQKIGCSRLDFSTMSEIMNCSQGVMDFLENAVNTLSLSKRKHIRIAGVARTIADLRNSEKVEEIDIKEALFYRMPHNMLA